MFGFDITSFCTETANILQFVGWILTLVKVAIPVIIIALGIFDLGKAVVSSKEDEIKTSAKRLLWRAIAGVAIFFLPSLILWLFGTVPEYANGGSGDFTTCRECILYPWGKTCNTAITSNK